MQPDADRFRRRDPSPVAEQSPPSAAASDRPQARPQRLAQGQGSIPQHGAPQPAADRFGAAAPPVARYAPPTVPSTRFAPPALAAQDAPLIHPAAAQASDALPYGIPVYRAPVYAYAPQPQRGLSITALVLGACSFLFAWIFVVVPIIGIVFGFIALRREPAGRTMAIIGLVASAIGLLWVLLFYLLPLIGVLGAMLFALGGA